MTRFADAENDHFAARVHRILDQSDCARKIIAQSLAEALELENFDVKNPDNPFVLTILRWRSLTGKNRP